MKTINCRKNYSYIMSTMSIAKMETKMTMIAVFRERGQQQYKYNGSGDIKDVKGNNNGDHNKDYILNRHRRQKANRMKNYFTINHVEAHNIIEMTTATRITRWRRKS